jgi:NhaP-type Na+/H+ or K+/H+ antiporter
MEHALPLGLASVVILGAAAQWLGWRIRMPAILLLLLFGFLAGPDALGLVDPDAMFGALFVPLVSLSVAFILFEGALTLNVRELGEHRGVVLRLITVGAVVGWLVTAWLAAPLLGIPRALALLVGAILTLSGPTVVLPILRQVRPTGRVGPVLKWEGILIDPVGAVLAVLVFEGIVAGGGLEPALGRAALGIVKTVLAGGAVGALGAGALVFVLKRYWVPDHLHALVALATAVAAYAASNTMQHESGLLAVTLMGALLAHQRQVNLRHVLEFKENLRTLVLSALFLLLAARVRAADLARIDLGAFVFLAALILLVRPLVALLCTLRSGLTWNERIFIMGLAPRGAVAATVTAVFAYRLEARGFEGASGVVAPMFLVVAGTVAAYGLGAGPLAYRLGLAAPDPQGVLFIGAHRFARELARALREQGHGVLLVDTNRAHVARARLDGLPVHEGSALSDTADEEIELSGLGRVLALTPNDETNALCALHYLHLFGRREIYQLSAEKHAIAPGLRGRILFANEWTYDALDARLEAGARIKATRLTPQFDFARWRQEHGERAVPLVSVAGGRVAVATVDRPLAPAPGEVLVGLVG